MNAIMNGILLKRRLSVRIKNCYIFYLIDNNHEILNKEF